MSDMFFKHEKISATDYVSIVRHMYMFKTMIQLYNDTFFIKIRDGVVEYSSADGLLLEEYFVSANIDSGLLLKYVKGLIGEVRFNVLEVLQSLYKTVSLSIVDYEELPKKFLDTNISPNFVYMMEFKSQLTYEKLKLITMCQELIDVLETYDKEEIIVPYYDCQSDTVSFSIKHVNSEVTGFDTIPLHGIRVFDVLLPVVAFNGSYGISVKQVIDNTNAVIQYLIRLFNEAVDGSYTELNNYMSGDFVLGNDTHIEYVSAYSNKKDTDTTKYVKVSNCFVRDCLAGFNDVKSIKLFVKAVENHLDMLIRPIHESFCTTASAIYGNIKLKYEYGNNKFDAYKVNHVVSTLLTLTSVRGGLPHIHQSAYMYLIDTSYMDTDFVDALEVLLHQLKIYVDDDTISVELDDNIVRVLGDGIDEVYDMSDYIDVDSIIGKTITLKELIDVIDFSLRVIKVFYHTWKSDDTVFIDAVNGLRLISSLQNEKLQFVSTYFNYSVDESLLFNTETIGYCNDDMLIWGDIVIPNSCRYENEELRKADFMYNIVKTRALGLNVILNSIAHEMFFNREVYSKSSCITMTTNKDFSMLYVSSAGMDTRKITIPKEFYHTAYALFNLSDYSFENITFGEVVHILTELKDTIGNASKFVVFYGVMGFTSLVGKLDLLSKYVCRDEDKVICNSEIDITKELVKAFIESGYEYISLYKGVMIVYSKDGNTSEIVPKSLHKFFYDTDKFNRVSLHQYIDD